MNVLHEIFDWSEVWAPLIPLAFLLGIQKLPHYLRPVVIYLLLALAIDLVIDVSWKFKSYVPTWLKDNNFLYSVHSVVRFIFFVAFFKRLNQPYLLTLKKIIPYISAVILIIIFSSEGFFKKDNISSPLLATEAGLLLFYCLQYYLYALRDETAVQKQQPEFWVVLGLSIYVVINFFIFLLYEAMSSNLKVAFWNVHNAAFILLCVFIAIGFRTVANEDPHTGKPERPVRSSISPG